MNFGPNTFERDAAAFWQSYAQTAYKAAHRGAPPPSRPKAPPRLVNPGEVPEARQRPLEARRKALGRYILDGAKSFVVFDENGATTCFSGRNIETLLQATNWSRLVPYRLLVTGSSFKLNLSSQ